MSGRDRRLDAVQARVARLRLPERLEDRFGRYRHAPERFAREVLGATSATRRTNGTSYQFEVLNDVAAHDAVAVRSGHGTGKTATCAWAVLWFVLTRPYSRVYILAPEHQRQIVAVFFAELRRWTRRALVPLPCTVLSNRLVIEGHGPEWGAIGASTAGDTERLEGMHAPGGLLLVLDECKAISQEAFDAVAGALTGEDAKLLLASVPGGAGAGPFWRTFAKGGERWHLHHLSSEDSTLVRPQWVEDRAKDWGRGSPLYETRVRGNFAESGEGILVPLHLLEAAVGRVLPPADPVPGLVLGVDVSRSLAGDLNCAVAVRGGQLERLWTWRAPDLMVSVQRVTEIATLAGARHLYVDDGGIGAGLTDRLRQLGKPVTGVQFGGAAHDTERFVNRRAEMFFRLRERLEKGDVAFPARSEDVDELIADLSAIRFTFDQRGRVKLEGKDEVRARLGRSPDRGDALALALGGARPDPAALTAGATQNLAALNRAMWKRGSTDPRDRHSGWIV